MPYLLLRLKVRNYNMWRTVFNERRAIRKAAGSKTNCVFRNPDNGNELVILLEWDDLKRAREYAQSDDLKKAMERAGVSEKSEVYFLEEAETPST